MLVRPKRDGDDDAITGLEQECFTDSWSPALMSQMFASQWDRIYVLEDEGKVIGYADIRNMYGDCDLMSICVTGTARKKGGASLLMRHMLEQARQENAEQIVLEVRKSNEAAIGLYRKFGFEELGTRRDYYSNPVEDAAVMLLKLKKQTVPSG